MEILELKNVKLEYTPRGYRDILPGYLMRNTHSWFCEPSFLACLEKPTYRYLVKFYEDYKGKYTRDYEGYLEGYLERHKEFIESHPDEEVIGVSTQITFEGLDLFSTNSKDKPTVTYAGIRSAHFAPSKFYYESKEVNNEYVEAWNYAPPYFKFMSDKKEKSKLFFGLELEVNSRIPWKDMRKIMLEVHPVQEEFMYAVSDSSISGSFPNCYEMVTHPMTPRRMRKEFRIFFNKLNSLVEAKGFKLEDVIDFDTNSTGIHIHVSRSGFASKYHTQRFLTTWNSDLPSVSRLVAFLAKRDLSRSSFAKPSVQYQGRRLGYCLSGSLDDTNGDRYCACNPNNKTLEVRVFRGTPSLSHVLYCIDSVESIFNFSKDLPIKSFTKGFDKEFKAWVSKQPKTKYRSLKEALKCV